MTNKVLAMQMINETLARKVKLVSAQDRETIAEGRERSQKRLGYIIAGLTETKIDQESVNRLQGEMIAEAMKLERLMILEGSADKNFFEIQKNFRSMVRAANVLIKWFPDSAMASKLSELRTQGIELLNGLYDHIKQMEAGADQEAAGVKLNKVMARQRDQFMRVFTDFAIIFRGMMSVADLFSEDPSRVGGYSDLKGIFAAFEADHELTDEPLVTACKIYDESKGKRNAAPGKTGIPDKRTGIMGKILGPGGGGKGGTAEKIKRAIAQAIQSTSPGFNKVVGIQDVIQAIMTRSLDQLRAYFQLFNDYVAADVDVNFLLQVSKNPRTIGSLFKGVWDALSGAGHMKMIH